MGKQGPCFHCGIDRTPLWRNGPPDKPVLCNACGSRYRLGKSLENYTPKNNALVIRKRKPKAISKAIVGDQKPVVTSNARGHASSSVQEDHNYTSSESSTMSHYHQSRLHIKQENRGRDINPDNHGGNLWGSSQIPSRRRSQVVYGSLTTIQKLQRDLHNILRDENPSSVSEPGPEDVLIYNLDINKQQIPSTEIGLGSILLKLPAPHSEEQKTEPCSFRLIDETASPSLQANACGDQDDVDVAQNEASPIDLENNGGNSPTRRAADS